MNTTCPDGDLKWLAPTTGNGKNVAWTTEESGFIKPALRCEVLGGVREGKQINLYWYTRHIQISKDEICLLNMKCQIINFQILEYENSKHMLCSGTELRLS